MATGSVYVCVCVYIYIYIYIYIFFFFFFFFFPLSFQKGDSVEPLKLPLATGLTLSIVRKYTNPCDHISCTCKHLQELYPILHELVF